MQFAFYLFIYKMSTLCNCFLVSGEKCTKNALPDSPYCGTHKKCKRLSASALASLSSPEIEFLQFGFEFETRNFIKTESYSKIIEKNQMKINDFTNFSLEHIPSEKLRSFYAELTWGLDFYNIEYQLGVFDNKGYDAFVKTLNEFIGVINEVTTTKKISVNGKDKEYDVEFFNTEESKFNEPNDTGVVQMTTTFQIKFLPNLFKLMSKFVNLSPLDFFNGHIYTTSYNETLCLLNSSKVDKSNIDDYFSTFGFMLYIVYYWKIRTETHFASPEKIPYLKAWFPIKPRTNFATLYENLSQHVKTEIRKILEYLINRLQYMQTNYLNNVILMLHDILKLDKYKTSLIKFYYIKNLPEVPDGFYYLEGCTYDDIKASFPDVDIKIKKFIGQYPRNYVTNILSFDGQKYSGIPDEVIEWPAEDDKCSLEFRIWKEIVRVTDRILLKKTKDDQNPNYQKLVSILAKDRIDAEDFKFSSTLVYHYFFPKIFTSLDKHDTVDLGFLKKKKIEIGIDYVGYKDIEDYDADFKNKLEKDHSDLGATVTGIESFYEVITSRSTGIKDLIEKELQPKFRPKKSIRKSIRKSMRKKSIRKSIRKSMSKKSIGKKLMKKSIGKNLRKKSN
jgi:hypothetical protein